MFEKRCSLCGGKLRGNICTECGLDNSKSDANYVSSGSTHRLGEGMTHEHKDNENPMAGKTVTKHTYRVACKDRTDVVAVVFVYGGKIIGGDIHCIGADGYMTGFDGETV